MRTLLFTGKGGAGKTTTAAAAAACAAARGQRTLVLSADAAHSLSDVLAQPLGPEPTPVVPGFCALEIDPRLELEQHWGSVREYLVTLFRHQGIEPTVAEELALLPGVEELAALLALERHARSGRFDLVVVDCAPTDSTLRLLTLPEAAHGALRLLLRAQQALAAVVSPVANTVLPLPLPGARVFRDAERLLYRKLRAVQARLRDPKTTIRIVLTPERLVIDESVRAHTDLALFELACDAVVMNRLLPEAAAAEPFFRERAELETERVREVEALFAPLPVLRAPLAEDEVVGPEALRRHGERLYGEGDPAAVLGGGARLRFARDGEGYRVDVPLPRARPDEVSVAKLDGALVVTTPRTRRSVALPRHLHAATLLGARLDGAHLRVRLGAASAPPPEV